MRTLYLGAAIVGAVGPYYYFAQFFAGSDASLSGFVSALFATAPASGFATDLLITSAVFWVWSFGEAKSRGMSHWWGYVVANLFIGLSFAFPLFLFMRARATDEVTRGTT